MQVDGNKNVVANAGGVANQITNINIKGMSEEQFKMISAQLSQVLTAIGVKDTIGEKPSGVTSDQQIIVREVEKKVKEAEFSFDKSVSTPETYFKLGNFEYNSGNFGKAVEYYNKALEINPKYDDAWNNKGAALSDLGRKEEAIRCYDKALEINPKSAVVWYNKGVTLANLGRKEEAKRCFEKSKEIDPRLR